MNSCLQVVKPSFQRKKSSGCLLVNLNVSWQTDNLPLKNGAPQTIILQKPSKLMLRLGLNSIFWGGQGGHNLFLKQNECHHLNLFEMVVFSTRSLPVDGAQIIQRQMTGLEKAMLPLWLWCCNSVLGACCATTSAGGVNLLAV